MKELILKPLACTGGMQRGFVHVQHNDVHKYDDYRTLDVLSSMKSQHRDDDVEQLKADCLTIRADNNNDGFNTHQELAL